MPVPLIGVGVAAAANFIVRKGVAKATKKYTPALISKAKKFITKNKLIASGNKVIKPKKGQIKTTKKTTTKKTTTKKTPTKTTTPTGTTKPGAKSKVPGLIIGVGTLGGGALLMKGGGDKGTSGSDMTFNQAFAKARKEKGKNATFSYKGKMYSTATMDDVKKAGFDNLKDYLNSMKKK
jgi:hypothetical protein